MPKKTYNQLILVEFNNACPFLYRVQSKKKITLDKIVKYFKDKEDFNEDKDAITYIDEPTNLVLY